MVREAWHCLHCSTRHALSCDIRDVAFKHHQQQQHASSSCPSLPPRSGFDLLIFGSWHMWPAARGDPVLARVAVIPLAVAVSISSGCSCCCCCLISHRILNMPQKKEEQSAAAGQCLCSPLHPLLLPYSSAASAGASSIKSKLEHISYPLDSSGARRRRLLAAMSVSGNGKTN